MKKLLAGLAVTSVILASSSSNAGTINILWYTGGTQPFSGTYQGDVNLLASQELTAPIAVHNTWNVTFWNGGAKPAGTFNVLVSASQEGGWATGPNYSSLVSAAGSTTLGDRIMVTGQDADWHYMNFPGSGIFNNPQGFLIDAINWAGSGTGLGAVFLSNPNSVYSAFGFLSTLGTDTGGSDTVIIPGAEASFPINEGLTSAGLSGWSTSAHDSWAGYDTTKWDGINRRNTDTGDAVTLVTKATASGGTGGAAPETPATAGLMGLSLLALLTIARSTRRSQVAKA